MPTQIWTLANYVLTTREAKRVFGMVGGGGIAGWIFSGYFSKAIAKTLRHGEPAAGHGAVSVDLCRADRPDLAQRTGRRRRKSMESTEGLPKQPANIFASMRLVFSSSYLRAIAAVICISSLVTTLTGWQFLAIAQQTL